MESFYLALFVMLAATAAALELGKGGASRAAAAAAPGNAVTREFGAFRSNYVLVYALMMGELRADCRAHARPRDWRACDVLHVRVACEGARGLQRSPEAAAPRSRALRIRSRSRSSPLLSLSAGDWLQGPYVYALYQHYGFNRGDIGRLFIAGFASSMVFGTIVGSLADRT